MLSVLQPKAQWPFVEIFRDAIIRGVSDGGGVIFYLFTILRYAQPQISRC